MAGTFQRLSLLLLAIALAVAPLRGALALSPLSAAPSVHHCTNGMHPAEDPACSHAMPGGHDGGHDCKRGCCGNACTCAPAATAITASVRKPPFLSVATPQVLATPGYSQRSLPPPFRPPLSATS